MLGFSSYFLGVRAKFFLFYGVGLIFLFEGLGLSAYFRGVRLSFFI